MILFRDFKGLASNVGPLAVPPGYFVSLTNLGCVQPGVLSGRKGLRRIDQMADHTFSYSASGTADVVSMGLLVRPEYTWMVLHLDDGALLAVRDGGTSSIGSGFDDFQPASWMVDRQGKLHIHNGLQRGKVWDGVSSSVWSAGITAPASAPTFSPASGAGNARLPLSVDTGGDLATNATDPKKVTSASHPFSAAEIGYLLSITAAGSWVGGTYEIVDVDGTAAILDRKPAPTSTSSGSWTLYQRVRYYAAYRYKDRYGNVSPLSPLAETDSLVGGTWTGGFRHTLTQSSETGRVTLVDVFRSTLDQDGVLYRVATLGHNGSVTSVGNSGGFAAITTTTPHSLAVGARITVAGNSVGGYNTTHEVTSVTSTTVVVTDIAYSSAGTGGTWTLTAFDEETASSDDDLYDSADADILPILNDDDSLNARRQVPPPTNKPFCCLYQDHAFYYGNVRYNEGTVGTGGSASTTITGSGTTFTSDMVGRYLYVAGQTDAWEITAYSSATSITVDHNATITNGTAYAILSEPAELRLLYFSEPDEPESVPATNAMPLQNNVADNDAETGMFAYGGYLWLLHERNLYRFTFSTRPDDGRVSHAAYRGCLNNQAWCLAEGVAYLMDQYGIYRLAGSSVDDLFSPPWVQNLWKSGQVDLSYSSGFRACYDPNEKVVRFFVRFASDSAATAYKTCLAYSTLTGAWWQETYHRAVRSTLLLPMDGRLRLVAGCADRFLCVFGDGTTDERAAITGTATAGGSTTLTDSGASFPTSGVGLTGCPVAIIAGTGAGQYRLVSSNTATELTVSSAWTTNPSTDSVYLVGAVELTARTGSYAYEIENQVAPYQPKDMERSVRLAFEKTTAATYLSAYLYLNRDSSPVPWLTTRDSAGGILLDAMNLSRSEAWTRKVFDVMARGYKPIDRWAALGLTGFQGAEQVKLYEIELTGLVS